MEQSDYQAQARQIIDRIKYITLATVSKDGDPWNAPVFFAHANYNTFYWGSRRQVQHSQNIRDNGKGYLAIYDSMITPGNGKAVYIKVKCQELETLEEITSAMQLLHERFGEPYMTPEGMQGASEHRLYKATLQQVWAKNETVDVREEIFEL